MTHKVAKYRIDEDGCLEAIDPGLDDIPLLKKLDPLFHIHQKKLDGFKSPKFLKTRLAGCGVPFKHLIYSPEESLWNLHEYVMDRLHKGLTSAYDDHEASILDLKIELARRVISHCCLCSNRCGVNRVNGEIGICGLGIDAFVAGSSIHIAEEPLINPSMLISLAGCGLRCKYCQQSELLSVDSIESELLEASLWSKINIRKARSLSFIGGNPDESLYAVLRFLSSAPMLKLPVVWNCHGYAAEETIRILDGVIDVYIPDIKYGNNDCGQKLSGVFDYFMTAQRVINEILKQDVVTILRILVLPGHFDCCHRPVIDFLSNFNNERRLYISVREQYCPDWMITSDDGKMSRRVINEEVNAVIELVETKDLQMID